MLGWLVLNLNTVVLMKKIHKANVQTDHWKRSELTNGKGSNRPMEKVRFNQWKRSEFIKEFFFLRSELTDKKESELTSGRVRIDQWSRSELTRAEFFKVRID